MTTNVVRLNYDIPTIRDEVDGWIKVRRSKNLDVDLLESIADVLDALIHDLAAGGPARYDASRIREFVENRPGYRLVAVKPFSERASDGHLGIVLTRSASGIYHVATADCSVAVSLHNVVKANDLDDGLSIFVGRGRGASVGGGR